MIYKQGDYVFQQSEYNNHYMIIHDNGVDKPRMVMHYQCTKKLTEPEAKRCIDEFLKNDKMVLSDIYNDESGADDE